MLMRRDHHQEHEHERQEETGLGITGTLGLMAAGAGLMYMLDPDRGRRRRAVLRDKSYSAARRSNVEMQRGLVDLYHRAYGTVAEVTRRFTGEQPSNEVLRERVRSKIGRVVSHPHAIQVGCHDGVVVFAGPILADEVDPMIDVTWNVPGVEEIDTSGFDVHDRAGDHPALQGQSQRPGDRWDVMQENWAPGSRLLAGAGGLGLAAYGLSQRGITGTLFTLVGGTLAARAFTNLDTGRLFGVGNGRRAVDVIKTINVNAPVEDVYDFWSNYENFPMFMHNVHEVRHHDNGTSHWVVAGPAGMEFEWDAVETERVPNELIAWKSIEGSSGVESAGYVRFQPNEHGGTRIQVHLSYNPPLGAIGHAVATLFGSDPKHEMDEDLMRMKTLIETGHFPHDAAQRPMSMPG